jgi:hypothetical protein
LERAKEKSVTVAMNCQLPFFMGDYEKLCGKVEVKDPSRFFIRLSPTPAGKEMIPDSVPHALSLLFSQFGEGRLGDVSFKTRGPDEMDIRFDYLAGSSGCEVHVKLVRKRNSPVHWSSGLRQDRSPNAELEITASISVEITLRSKIPEEVRGPYRSGNRGKNFVDTPIF